MAGVSIPVSAQVGTRTPPAVPGPLCRSPRALPSLHCHGLLLILCSRRSLLSDGSGEGHHPDGLFIACWLRFLSKVRGPLGHSSRSCSPAQLQDAACLTPGRSCARPCLSPCYTGLSPPLWRDSLAVQV